jgi:two-component system sensor histidine kinase CreC
LNEAQQVSGEPFMLRQTLAILLDSAVDFTPPGGPLRCSAQVQVQGEQLTLCVFNQAGTITDYALPRLSERFYCLPRPKTGRKSSGLGLNFVQEVAALHGGSLRVANVPGGVAVFLCLPCA